MLEAIGLGVEASKAGVCEPVQAGFDFAIVNDDGADKLGWSRRELKAGTYYLAIRSHGIQRSYEIGVPKVVGLGEAGLF